MTIKALCKPPVFAAKHLHIITAGQPPVNSGPGLQTKILRVMRLTAAIMFIFSLHVSAIGTAQNVSLSVENATLESVFKSIKRQTKFTFIAKAELLDQGKKVTLDLDNVPLEEALDACFKNQPFTYSVEGRIITIVPLAEGLSPRLPLGPRPVLTTEIPPINVRGIVTNEDGEPVAGATVTIKGSNRATSTDGVGRFSLNANEKEILVITSVGFETQEIKLTAKDASKGFRISMIKKTSDLDAVVILPYGTTTKRLNTGNISTVTSKTIQQQPVSNPLAALTGRVPGLVITQTTGTPGGGFNVQIRGKSSIINGSNPFYVVDGVPYNSTIPAASGQQGLLNSNLIGGSPLNFINPYDIESIEVLKDADATAIYGSRAANGAILITTKRGKSGPMRVDVNVNSGLTTPARDIKLMNTQEYLTVRHEAFRNDGIPTIPATAYDLTTWDTTRYTDWSKVFLQNKAVYTDANASISGGSINTQYLIGAGYNRQTTGMPSMIPNSGADQRGSVHLNVTTISPDKKFKLSLTASYASDLNTVNAATDLSNTRITTPPDAPPLYNLDGTLNWAPLSPGLRGTWTNPLGSLNGKYKSNTSNIVSNMVVGYTILPGLEIKSSFGYTNTQIDEVATTPTTVFDPGRRIANGSSRFGATHVRGWIIEPQANYKVNIGYGQLTALVGGSFHENNSQAKSFNGTGFVSNGLLENIESAGSISPFSSSSQYKYNAVFGRLNYNWSDRYIVNFTARRDGSSRFGPGKQFGNFGSGAAAWIFSNEKFLKNNLSFLSFGKLRASYGTTGNDQVGDYKFLDLYSSVYYPYLSSPGLAPQTLFNPDLAWEIGKKFEAGIELGFLKDRIMLQANIYRNRSENQLVTTPVSQVTGFSSIPSNLPAVIQNSGKEFELHSSNIKSKNFSWSSIITLTIPKNKLLAFPGLENSSYSKSPYSYTVGQPVTIKKVYHLIGVNDTTGIYQFADFKGMPTYTPGEATDMTSIVNPAPKYYGGFLNSFSYKGFSLDVFFQFVKQTGLSLFGSYAPQMGLAFNMPADYLDHWQNPGDKAKYQMASQSFGSQANAALNYAQQSDLNYTDASFIRMKNFAFSWQLPGDWKQKMHLQNCRIYVNAQNLVTITKYDGLDPESQSVAAPPKKVWTAGLQLGF